METKKTVEQYAALYGISVESFIAVTNKIKSKASDIDEALGLEKNSLTNARIAHHMPKPNRDDSVSDLNKIRKLVHRACMAKKIEWRLVTKPWGTFHVEHKNTLDANECE